MARHCRRAVRRAMGRRQRHRNEVTVSDSNAIHFLSPSYLMFFKGIKNMAPAKDGRES